MTSTIKKLRKSKKSRVKTTASIWLRRNASTSCKCKPGSGIRFSQGESQLHLKELKMLKLQLRVSSSNALCVKGIDPCLQEMMTSNVSLRLLYRSFWKFFVQTQSRRCDTCNYLESVQSLSIRAPAPITQCTVIVSQRRLSRPGKSFARGVTNITDCTCPSTMCQSLEVWSAM